MRKHTRDLIREAKDKAVKIEYRMETAVNILQKMSFKNKPSEDDMRDIRKVIKILKG
jgi:hypothetical protein